eukprot:11177650-Lingulodinium_polyedra.AAC.1
MQETYAPGAPVQPVHCSTGSRSNVGMRRRTRTNAGHPHWVRPGVAQWPRWVPMPGPGPMQFSWTRLAPMHLPLENRT